MTCIKLCGLSRGEDVLAVNRLRPEFVGFVFAPGSRRRVSPERAEALRALLSPGIRAVGVFVDQSPEEVADLLDRGIIQLAQLHGHEDGTYLRRLRSLTSKPIIQAFRVASEGDVRRASESQADYILLDSGAGSGSAFDWRILSGLRRPYFLAGGLGPDNVGKAVARLRLYGVDVSSGIETGGVKDPEKMAAFVAAVRKEAEP